MKPEKSNRYFEIILLSIRSTVIVEPAQGDVLHTNLPNAQHGEGDYLICSIGEDGGPDLSDVWVLNGLIFPDCYDTSHMNEK